VVRALTAALPLLALVAQDADAAAGRYRLALPHPVHTGERVILQVSVGTLPKGTEIVVTTPSGELLGAVSPFGTTGPAIYQLPVPNTTRAMRLVVRRFGVSPRPPNAQELTGLKLVVR